MQILGVHKDFPFLRVSLIRKSGQKIDIRWMETLPMVGETEAIDSNGHSEALAAPKQPNVKRLYIQTFRGKVVSGLAATDFLVRTTGTKNGSFRYLEETLSFKSEALSHFKPNEILAIPLVEKGQSEALIFTIPRSEMRKHLDELAKWGIDPDVVSTTASALCHFIRWKFPKVTNAFIVDIGSEGVTCVFMENGRLKRAHPISIGVENLLAALYDDRKRVLLKTEIEGAAQQIDLLLFKPHLNPHLSMQLNSLRQEIGKVHYSYTKNKVCPLLFTGRTDAFIHLPEFLIDFARGEWTLSLEEQKYAVSLGLCLEQILFKPLQLRRGEFFPKKNWIRMGKIALALLGTSLFLSALLFFWGIRFEKSAQEQMLHMLHPSLPKEIGLEGSMEERIDRWIEMVEENNREYPYLPTAPKVVEVLAWLSSHPLLEALRGENDPMDVRELRVELVQFPTLSSAEEPYLERVELEFSLKNVMNARRFHEMLRQGDDLVNPHLEISWDVLNESYRTTFYLKNRTPYVP